MSSDFSMLVRITSYNVCYTKLLREASSVVVFVIMVIVLLVRPAGLFGKT